MNIIREWINHWIEANTDRGLLTNSGKESIGKIGAGVLAILLSVLIFNLITGTTEQSEKILSCLFWFGVLFCNFMSWVFIERNTIYSGYWTVGTMISGMIGAFISLVKIVT